MLQQLRREGQKLKSRIGVISYNEKGKGQAKILYSVSGWTNWLVLAVETSAAPAAANSLPFSAFFAVVRKFSRLPGLADFFSMGCRHVGFFAEGNIFISAESTDDRNVVIKNKNEIDIGLRLFWTSNVCVCVCERLTGRIKVNRTSNVEW